MECYKCKKEFSEIKSVFDHLKKVHKLGNNKEKLQCVVRNDCSKGYMNFDSLRQHVKECMKKNGHLEVLKII